MNGGIGRAGAVLAVILTAASACKRSAERPAQESRSAPAGESAAQAPSRSSVSADAAPSSAVASAEPAAPAAIGEGGTGPPATRGSATPDAVQQSPPAGPTVSPSAAQSPVAPPRPPLAPPAGLAAVATSETEVDLRWETTTGGGEAVSFEVLRDGAVVATAAGATARHAGLGPAETACYSVRSVDPSGRRSRPSPPVCVTTPDRTPPEAPTALVAEASSDREVTLSWSAARDSVGVVRYDVLDGDAVVATTDATTARVASLSPWREYCFTVVALDAAGNRSPPAKRACVRTVDVTPPTPPTTPTATAIAETQVELAWGESTDDAGVKGYRVLRDEAVVVTTQKVTARETKLRAATEYCYTIVAFDAAGNVSAPAGPACATTPDLTPPTQPGVVAVKALGEDRIEIRWGAASDNVGVAAYEVRRAGEVRLRETALHAEEGGLRPYTNYCYSVVALDAAGNRSTPTVSECARTLDLTPPTTPRELVIRPPGHLRLEARWGPSSDNAKVAGYELLRDGHVVASAAGSAVDVVGLAHSSEYCFAVRAFDPAGNRSKETGVSCGRTLEPEQPVPPRNVVVHRKPGAVQLAWEDAGRPNVVFRIYEDGRPIGATRAVKYSLRRADAKRRCYSIGAVDEAGRESPRSEEACVTFVGEASSAR